MNEKMFERIMSVLENSSGYTVEVMTEKVWIDALINGIGITIVVLLCGFVIPKALLRKKDKIVQVLDDDVVFWMIYIGCLVMALISFFFLTNFIPPLIAPEGYAIKEILEAIRG